MKRSTVKSYADVLKPQAFVASITRKQKSSRQLRTIRGYVGTSNKSDCVRIYLDIELRRFVDVPNKGIVHAEAISETLQPLGGVYIWVRDDVAIRHNGAWFASEDPTTMATGEEGGGDPTTMATGEEGAGIENPLDLVVNPFGRF